MSERLPNPAQHALCNRAMERRHVLYGYQHSRNRGRHRSAAADGDAAGRPTTVHAVARGVQAVARSERLHILQR